MNSKLKILIFALIPTILLFGLLEIGLRVAGFKYSHTPLEARQDVEGAAPGFVRWVNRDGVIRFKKDPDQLWVPVDDPLKKYAKQKKDGVIRIATLGCSCTIMCAGSDRTYPQVMQEVLNDKDATKYEVINFGVAGFSSYQGLKRLQLKVLDYNPDIITIYFGWNDHWIAPQEDKNVKIHAPWAVSALNAAEHLRSFQLLNYAISQGEQKIKEVHMQLRVAPDDYRKNLEAMVDLAQARGIKVVLITAAYQLDNFPPTSFFPFGKEKLLPIHRRYNEIVREVAKAKNTELLDMEAVQVKEPQLDLISEDGIHLSDPGCGIVGKLLIYQLAQRKLL